MSSTLRLSIIMVLLLATAALGLMAYTVNLPKPMVQVTEKAPAPAPRVGYFVAARPLPRGTLAREEDFALRSAPSDSVPTGAILDTPDTRIGLRGSLVRNFLDTDSPVTSQDVLRPRDRGFLASVLAPDTRAISIKVDAASGVSGLIWPGDYVDVVSTQVINKAENDSLSETVLHNVRVVAVDQEVAYREIVQVGPPNNAQAINKAAAGKQEQYVSLQLAPEQVKKIVVAQQLGNELSLAVRSAVDQPDTEDLDTTIAVYAGNKVKKYSVKKNHTVNTANTVSAGASPEIARQRETAVADAGANVKGYPVKLPGKQ